MTTNLDLAPDRRRRRMPLAVGRRPYAPSCITTPTVGRLVVTRLGAADPAEPASIDSISVRSARPDGSTPTVLHYRNGAGDRPGHDRGYWAAAGAAVLGRPGFSGRSRLPGGARAAASTTGS